MASSDSLDAIEPFLHELMQAVEPRQRQLLADKLMRLARRANAERIAANVTPDGGAMAARKKRPPGGKRGKMFRRIGKAASLKIRATPDGGELRFANPMIEDTAATHHFGLEGFVGKNRAGRVVRTKYQARELLGHGPEREEYLDEVLRHLGG